MRAIRLMLSAGLAALVVAAFLVGLGSTPSPAVAVPVQDRACDPPADGTVALVDGPGNDQQATQVFLSGLSGPLARVSLYGARNDQLQDVVVELRNTTLQNGQRLPGATVLATATIPGSAISIGAQQWFDVTFTTPAAVTADQFYAVVIDPRSTAGQSSLLELAGRSGCALGGVAAVRGPTFNRDVWVVLGAPVGPFDAFLFRSFVDLPTPPPSSSPSTSPPASSPAPKPGVPTPGPTTTPGSTPTGTTKPEPATPAPTPISTPAPVA